MGACAWACCSQHCINAAVTEYACRKVSRLARGGVRVRMKPYRIMERRGKPRKERMQEGRKQRARKPRQEGRRADKDLPDLLNTQRDEIQGKQAHPIQGPHHQKRRPCLNGDPSNFIQLEGHKTLAISGTTNGPNGAKLPTFNASSPPSFLFFVFPPSKPSSAHVVFPLRRRHLEREIVMDDGGCHSNAIGQPRWGSLACPMDPWMPNMAL